MPDDKWIAYENLRETWAPSSQSLVSCTIWSLWPWLWRSTCLEISKSIALLTDENEFKFFISTWKSMSVTKYIMRPHSEISWFLVKRKNINLIENSKLLHFYFSYSPVNPSYPHIWSTSSQTVAPSLQQLTNFNS